MPTKKMKRKGAQAVTVGLVAIIAVVAVGVVLLMNQTGWGGGGGADLQGTADQPLVTTAKCQDDGTNSLSVASRNPANVSLHYNAGSYAAVGADGEIIASGTGTAGTSISYTAVAIPCAEGNYAGDVYALLTSAYNSQIGTYDTIESGATADTVVLDVVPAGSLKIAAFDTTLTNTTQGNSADDTESGCAETEVDTNAISTIEAGGSFTRYIDFKQATAYKQFGSDVAGQAGVLVLIDNNNMSSWNSNDIKITSVDGGGNLKSVDCVAYPKEVSLTEADSCYTMDSIASNDATRRLKIEGVANSGNPYSDVVVTFMDLGYFQDVDGSIKYAGANSAATSQGQTDCTMTINIG